MEALFFTIYKRSQQAYCWNRWLWTGHTTFEYEILSMYICSNLVPVCVQTDKKFNTKLGPS
jgi:hypothetical protein